MSRLACSRAIVMCPIHDCNKCSYRDNMEECPFAAHNDASDCIPTFADALAIYGRSQRTQTAHKEEVERCVKKDLAELGIPLEAPVTMMTRPKFKELIARLTSPERPATRYHPEGGALADSSVASHLSAFKSLASDTLEDLYEEEGFDLPSFSVPHFDVRKKPVQEVSDRTVRNVEIQMEKWLASGRRSDRDAYVLCFFALYCGFRLGDICHATWSVFRHTTAGLIVSWVPRKSITARRPQGKPMSFRMSHKTYLKIETCIEGENDPVLTRYKNRTPKNMKRRDDRRFENAHRSLVNRVNRALEACGIGTEFTRQKKLHALRKYFATERELSYGDGAASIGDTNRVGGEYYIGTLAGKVS